MTRHYTASASKTEAFKKGYMAALRGEKLASNKRLTKLFGDSMVEAFKKGHKVGVRHDQTRTKGNG